MTYEATLVRQTRCYWVYEYGANEVGQPFTLYVKKADFPDAPSKAELTLEGAK